MHEISIFFSKCCVYSNWIRKLVSCETIFQKNFPLFERNIYPWQEVDLLPVFQCHFRLCAISTGAVIIETASSYYRDPWPFPECSNLVSNHAKDSKKATGSHTIFSLPVYLTFQIIFLNCPRLVSDTLDFQNFLRENISHQNELELLKLEENYEWNC